MPNVRILERLSFPASLHEKEHCAQHQHGDDAAFPETGGHRVDIGLVNGISHALKIVLTLLYAYLQIKVSNQTNSTEVPSACKIGSKCEQWPRAGFRYFGPCEKPDHHCVLSPVLGAFCPRGGRLPLHLRRKQKVYFNARFQSSKIIQSAL